MTLDSVTKLREWAERSAQPRTRALGVPSLGLGKRSTRATSTHLKVLFMDINTVINADGQGKSRIEMLDKEDNLKVWRLVSVSWLPYR